MPHHLSVASAVALGRVKIPTNRIPPVPLNFTPDRPDIVNLEAFRKSRIGLLVKPVVAGQLPDNLSRSMSRNGNNPTVDGVPLHNLLLPQSKGDRRRIRPLAPGLQEEFLTARLTTAKYIRIPRACNNLPSNRRRRHLRLALGTQPSHRGVPTENFFGDVSGSRTFALRIVRSFPSADRRKT